MIFLAIGYSLRFSVLVEKVTNEPVKKENEAEEDDKKRKKGWGISNEEW